MYRYCLDSSFWVEYFSGSKLGLKARSLLESGVQCFSPSVVLTEVGALALRAGENAAGQMDEIRSRSVIVPISSQIAIRAGEEKAKHSLYALDAIIYACSVHTGSVLITQDKPLLLLKDTRRLESF